MFYELIILQITAHLLADFYFQTNSLANRKEQFGFKSGWLYLHTFIVFCLAWLFSLQLNFIIAAGFIALTHVIIDGVKSELVKRNLFKQFLFFSDQLMHFLIILLVVYYWDNHVDNTELPVSWDIIPIISVVLAFLLCAKPANIIIREVLKAYKISLPKEAKSGLKGAGRLIGTTERWLILIFIMIDQFTAIGFLIAAKSILRYKEPQTEYILTGTILSFIIAIVAGIALF